MSAATTFSPRGLTFEAESLLPPDHVYMQPRLAASDIVASSRPRLPSAVTPTRTSAPVENPGPIILTADSPIRPVRRHDDSIAEVPRAPSSITRNLHHDA